MKAVYFLSAWLWIGMQMSAQGNDLRGNLRDDRVEVLFPVGRHGGEIEGAGVKQAETV